jgi:hypothetical protein
MLTLQINKKYPKLHILVNNAGVSFMKKGFTADNVGVIAQVVHGCIVVACDSKCKYNFFMELLLASFLLSSTLCPLNQSSLDHCDLHL